MPNIRVYNLASLFRHMRDWLLNNDQSSKLEPGKQVASPWDLGALLHTKNRDLPTLAKLSVLMNDTYRPKGKNGFFV